MWDREKGRASGPTVLQHSAPCAERFAELGRLGLAGDGQGVVRLILVPFRIVNLVPILVVRVDEPRWTPLRITGLDADELVEGAVDTPHLARSFGFAPRLPRLETKRNLGTTTQTQAKTLPNLSSTASDYDCVMPGMNIAALAHNHTAAVFDVATHKSSIEARLPPINVLPQVSSDSRSATSSPTSIASSSDDLEQSNSMDSHDQPSSPSSELDELAPPKDDVEMGDDHDAQRPQSSSTNSSTSTSTSSPPLTDSPKWTTHWASPAPPPKAINTFVARNSISNSPAAAQSCLGVARRHHPYAPSSGPSSRGATTPSPTWPAHIGIHDQGEPHPSSLPQSRHDNNVLFSRHASDLHSNRGRSATMAGPPHSDPRRPIAPLRNLSFGKTATTPTSASPGNDRSMLNGNTMHFDVRRLSRGDSGATADSYAPSTMPSSPLLFAPLTPQGQEQPRLTREAHRPLYSVPHPPAAAPIYHDESPSVNSAHLSPYEQPRHYPLESPAVQRRSLQLAPHPHQHQQHQQMPPPAPYYLQQQHQQRPMLAKRRAESWQSMSMSGEPIAPAAQQAQVNASPAQPQFERLPSNRRRRRPPFSYSSLIAQAISSSPAGRMTLREIYTWISNAYPDLYSMDGADSQGWQNTVRHNLSLNKSFVKVARTAQDIYDSCASANPAHSQAARGKGGWWTIDPVVATAQLGPNYRGTENGSAAQSSPPMPQGFGRRGSDEVSSEERAYPYSNGVIPSVLSPPAHYQQQPPQHHGYGLGVAVHGSQAMPSVLQSPSTRNLPPITHQSHPHQQAFAGLPPVARHAVNEREAELPIPAHLRPISATYEDRDVTPKATEYVHRVRDQRAHLATEEGVSPRTTSTSTFAADSSSSSSSSDKPASGRMAISDLLC
ncbi:hypothetical protein BDZ90DRAFT_225421 [Jaminaea rosea]|uniref:Fork-head domain-containing protein n=1 Tax=Jaminaea rosea TaxID=1569628 RepID=A0A316V2D0_9BASI|nr:hypothetical protein BDZ90DRAFT_225421 [Jaminaea rosea]PWN30721.1 hypothetical protein BDZ90DRAFT_225421 [Jaminaea rosea]